MATVISRTIGGLALALGIAWVIWPMRMVELQYRILYFWNEVPDLEDLNRTVARGGGVLLAALGAALVVGLMP